MAETNEEKGLLRPSHKSHRHYGSTTVNMKKLENIVLHRVSKCDTIQGIALRYGVTVELLKIHNKLWSPESIFLHDFLEVPVSQSEYEALTKACPSIAQIPVSPSHTNGSSPFRDSDSSCSESSSSNLNKVSTSQKPSPPSPNGMYDCSEKSSEDILSRIDSNIALMKLNVKKMEAFSYPVMDQMEIENSNRNNSYHHKRHSSEPNNFQLVWERRQNGWQDPTLPPTTIVTSSGRRITMSLKRLLREQEDLCEL